MTSRGDDGDDVAREIACRVGNVAVEPRIGLLSFPFLRPEAFFCLAGLCQARCEVLGGLGWRTALAPSLLPLRACGRTALLFCTVPCQLSVRSVRWSPSQRPDSWAAERWRAAARL